jgi:hypothetical protein
MPPVMDEFARRPADDRRAFIEEAANRRDLTPVIVEKDFWVCWTLRRLIRAPELKDQVTFKGGTSLSKAYGIIQRFSEDIDLTIRRSAPLIDKVAPPMAEGIGTNERDRRTKALRAAAQAYVQTVAMPKLVEAIEQELGTTEGWSVELDPEDKDQQTLLFNYPRTSGWGENWGASWGTEEGAGYIKPRIKLEYGARGEPEPFEDRAIVPYLAEEFPDEFPNASTPVPTLSILRTYWEKATILHSLHHKGKLRAGLSRHYYDLLMLDRAGVSDEARAHPELLAAVVRNKSLMFADKAASYDSAVLGQLRLRPTEAMQQDLASDYAAMADMFMIAPPGLSEMVDGIGALESRLNTAEETAPAA